MSNFTVENSIVLDIKKIVLNCFSEKIEPKVNTKKEKYDYVTTLDVRIEDALKKFLQVKFPNHIIIGEESCPEVLFFDGPTWIIDPLDGTSNFVFNVPFYGLSIAFAADGKVEFGMVLDYVSGEIFSAFRGKGAFKNSDKLRISPNKSDFIGVSSGFIQACANQAPELLIQLKNQGKFRLLGSQALHLCYVAANRFKMCINFEAKLWDDLAGSLIVSEAGGNYFNAKGVNIDSLGRVELLASLFSVAGGSIDENVKNIYSKIKMN